MQNKLTTLQSTTSQGLPDLVKHRAMIAFELEVMAKKFDRFGWDKARGTKAHDRLVMDWMDALQGSTLDEVKAACRSAVIHSPNKMPNEGHIHNLIMKSRAKPHKVSEPEPDIPRPTLAEKKRVNNLLKKNGYGFQRIKNLTGHPK